MHRKTLVGFQLEIQLLLPPREKLTLEVFLFRFQECFMDGISCLEKQIQDSCDDAGECRESGDPERELDREENAGWDLLRLLTSSVFPS